MKKKHFPYPALLLLVLVWLSFLTDDDSSLWSMLFILALFLAVWYCIGPDMEPPSVDDINKTWDFSLRTEEENAVVHSQNLMLWVWSWRLYEDRPFRNKILAVVLTAILTGTGGIAWLSEEADLRRCVWITGACALGLLALAVDWLIHRPRQNG